MLWQVGAKTADEVAAGSDGGWQQVREVRFGLDLSAHQRRPNHLEFRQADLVGVVFGAAEPGAPYLVVESCRHRLGADHFDLGNATDARRLLFHGSGDTHAPGPADPADLDGRI